jgi:hypothetical protein
LVLSGSSLTASGAELLQLQLRLGRQLVLIEGETALRDTIGDDLVGGLRGLALAGGLGVGEVALRLGRGELSRGFGGAGMGLGFTHRRRVEVALAAFLAECLKRVGELVAQRSRQAHPSEGRCTLRVRVEQLVERGKLRGVEPGLAVGLLVRLQHRLGSRDIALGEQRIDIGVRPQG